MSNAAQFFGGRGAPRPTGLLNGSSALVAVATANAKPLTFGQVPMARTVASGPTTAGVLKTILSLSGSGVISLLAVESVDATSRTHRLKVTLDGVVIFDATSAAVASVSQVLSAIGGISYIIASLPVAVSLEPLAFSTSLLIEYACSLTETDGATIGYRYYPI